MALEQCPICSKIPQRCSRSHVYDDGIGEHTSDCPPEVEQLAELFNGSSNTSILTALQCATCRRLYVRRTDLVGENTYVEITRHDLAALFDHEACMRQRLPDRDVSSVHADRFFPRHAIVRLAESWAAVDAHNQVTILNGFHSLARLVEHDRPTVITEDLELAKRYARLVGEIEQPGLLRPYSLDHVRWRSPLTAAEQQRIDAAKAATNDLAVTARRIRDGAEVVLWVISRGDLIRHTVTVRINGTTYCHPEVIARQLPTTTAVDPIFASLAAFRSHCSEPTSRLEDCPICSKIEPLLSLDEGSPPELARLEHFFGESVQRCPSCRRLYHYQHISYGNDIYTGNDSSEIYTRLTVDELFDHDWAVARRLPDWRVRYVPSANQFFPHHVIVRIEPDTWAALDHENRLLLLDHDGAFGELIDRDPPSVTADLDLANKYALFVDEIDRPDDRRPGRWDFLHNWNHELTPEQQRQLDDAKEASGLGKGLPPDAVIDMHPVATREGDTIVVRSWVTSNRRLIHRIITVQPTGHYIREDAVIAEDLPI